MYYIGIDISKFKHDCAVIDDFGEIVTPSWSFTNDSEGFSQLKLLLDSLDAEARIGLESTGHLILIIFKLKLIMNFLLKL